MTERHGSKLKRKKHKLYIITPSGEEHQLGFLTPCKDGFVLGTPHTEGIETSHLTTIFKRGLLSSHITPQDQVQDRQYFPPISKEKIVEKVKALTEENIISQLPTAQLSENVFYVTQKLLDWLESLINTLYEKKISLIEVIHILNFKKLLRNVPRYIEELKKSPYSFFGVCKAREILDDNSKVCGITESGLVITPLDDQLYCIDFSLFTSFSFVPTMEEKKVSTLFDEIYRSMGVSQYMEEVQKKRFLEKLFSKERKHEDR